jgi:LPXTG-site transpeptidase (sortase) family protein
VLIGLAARQETFAHPTTRLFMWLVPGTALIIALAGAGLSVWQTMGGRAALSAGRAVALPGGLGPAPTAGGPEAGLSLSPAEAAASPAAGRPLPPLVPDDQLAPEASPPRLQIPSLDLDEAVRPILLRDGEWDITPLGLGIGWLESTGARPLSDLAMVLIGHLTLSAAQRGPFADLQHIARGAEIIYVLDGEAFVYAVREKGRLTTDDVGRIYLPDGRSLLLITCTDWDFEAHEYAKRLLVRAELVERRWLSGPAAGVAGAGP